MPDQQVVPVKKLLLVEKFAERFNLDPTKFVNIIKATAFRVSSGEVSNEQLAALLVVADQYGLNPFTREIFAFEDRNRGIVPVVSVDGWARIINDHPQFDGMEFVVPEKLIKAAHGGKAAAEWMECVIYRKDRAHPIRVREYLEEVYQPPRGQNSSFGPWQSHPMRMHRHKTLIQCARLAFGFSGIYDEDEAERIANAKTIDASPVPIERSATARMRAALIPPEKEIPAEQPETPTDLRDAIDLMVNTTDSMTSVFNAISMSALSADHKRDFMERWNAKVREMKGITDEPNPATEPTPEKEKGSAQRLGNIKKQLGEIKTQEEYNDILDLCRAYQWTPEQRKQIDDAAAAALNRIDMEAI